jgi:predicted PurR-regulated permease PerM
MVSVLPMLGASMVWVSGTAILLATHRFGAAVVLLLIGSLISAHVETFIRPIVSRRVSRIHPLITLVGAFAGVQYIGLPGLLLGPLALAYFFELLRAFEVEFLGREAPVAEIGR